MPLAKRTLRRYIGAMLKTRIIPCLDVADGRVVKGVNFVDLRDAGVGEGDDGGGERAPLARCERDRVADVGRVAVDRRHLDIVGHIRNRDRTIDGLNALQKRRSGNLELEVHRKLGILSVAFRGRLLVLLLPTLVFG